MRPEAEAQVPRRVAVRGNEKKGRAEGIDARRGDSDLNSDFKTEAGDLSVQRLRLWDSNALGDLVRVGRGFRYQLILARTTQ
jgi:hypothetical protein